MQTIFTSLEKTDSTTEKKRSVTYQQLQPNKVSLQKILQFASTYRAEQVTENQFVELYLN